MRRRSFSSSGRSKKAVETLRMRSTSEAGTPWPETSRKPISAQAAFTALATARRSASLPCTKGEISMRGMASVMSCVARASVRSLVVDHDDAMQAADVVLLVPFAGAVQAASIVGHQDVARLPAMPVGEAILDHVVQQFVIKRLRLVRVHALDTGSPFAAQVQPATLQFGMRADQRMEDIGYLAPLRFHLLFAGFREEIAEQPRAAVQHLLVVDLRPNLG